MLCFNHTQINIYQICKSNILQEKKMENYEKIEKSVSKLEEDFKQFTKEHKQLMRDHARIMKQLEKESTKTPRAAK